MCLLPTGIQISRPCSSSQTGMDFSSDDFGYLCSAWIWILSMVPTNFHFAHSRMLNFTSWVTNESFFLFQLGFVDFGWPSTCCYALLVYQCTVSWYWHKSFLCISWIFVLEVLFCVRRCWTKSGNDTEIPHATYSNRLLFLYFSARLRQAFKLCLTQNWKCFSDFHGVYLVRLDLSCEIFCTTYHFHVDLEIGSFFSSQTGMGLCWFNG